MNASPISSLENHTLSNIWLAGRQMDEFLSEDLGWLFKINVSNMKSLCNYDEN